MVMGDSHAGLTWSHADHHSHNLPCSDAGRYLTSEVYRGTTLEQHLHHVGTI